MGVQGAGGDLVQAGLPDVDRGPVDQQHPASPVAPSQLPPQPRGQQKTAGAAADDDEIRMHVGPRCLAHLHHS